MKQFLGKRLTKLWNDRTGGLLIFAAIAAPVMIGVTNVASICIFSLPVKYY